MLSGSPEYLGFSLGDFGNEAARHLQSNKFLNFVIELCYSHRI